MNVYPSLSNWITARTDGVELTTQNCQIILNHKTDHISKVLVNGESVIIPSVTISTPADNHVVRNVKFSQLSTSQSEDGLLKEIDISNYVVEEAKYNTLPVTNLSSQAPVKNNTWYYEHNGDRIYVINNYLKGWQIQNSVASSLIVAAAGYPLFYFYEGEWYRITYNQSTNLSESLLQWQFRVYYTPLGESVKLNVPKTNPQPVKFSIPYSQSQNIVDNVTHGREMQSIANRTGCEKKQVIRTLTDIKQYRSPYGGYFWKEKDANGNLTGNIWKLTKCELTVLSSEYMRVVETWSKNWTYRSENVPINREYRSWNIPADIVQRDLLYQDYCLITRKDVSLPNDAIFSQGARSRLLLELTDHAALNEECNTMWFYTGEGNDRKGAVLSCSAFGFGNSLVFSGKTKDNLSAGVQRVPRDSGDSDYQFCKDVYYCQDDGKLDYMKVQIGTGTYSTDETVGAYLYPEFKREGTNYYNSFSSFTLLNEKNFKILKDPSEQLNFTYQLHLLTDDGFLVIGATWAAENPLVKSQPKAKKIKVWKLTQNIASGAQVMIPLYGSVVSDPTNWFVANPTTQTIHFIPHDGAVGVCVTDENNAVLIAYNNDDEATFTMKYTHNYKTLYAALHSNDPD